MSNTERIKNNLPLISIGIVVFSLLRLLFYYRTFNISITDYIDLGEAIILSFEAYLPILLYATIVLTIIYFAQDSKLYTKYNPERFAKITNPDSFLERVKLFIKDSGRYLSLLPFILLVIAVITLFIDKELAKGIFISAGFTFAYNYHPFLIYEVSRKQKVVTGKHLSAFTINTVRMLLLLAFITLANTYADAISALNSKDYKKVFVGIGSKPLKSSDNFRYVGKTKDFIFFFDKKRKACKVYPLDKIDSLSIE